VHCKDGFSKKRKNDDMYSNHVMKKALLLVVPLQWAKTWWGTTKGLPGRDIQRPGG